jgi:diphosphomevalonate decarboxylase
MDYSEKYLKAALAKEITAGRQLSGSVTWKSPSNIALVKYWGKKGFQWPANPSLSITLSNSHTITSVQYETVNGGKTPKTEFYFEGNKNGIFTEKAFKFMQNISGYFPFLPRLNIKIESSNSFPHSAGIASSASSMSSLALCFLSIERHLLTVEKHDQEFYRKASFIARIGSGSAARSVYGKYVQWGEYLGLPDSSDEYAIPLIRFKGDYYENIQDAILIVSSGAKKISSSLGHELMNGNIYARSRFLQANRNLEFILKSAETQDIKKLTEIVEEEALSLHAMMMSSKPSYILMEPNTIEIINRIRAKREKDGLQVMFTLDAGPNIHMLYSKADEKAVKDFINKELIQFCESGKVIYDGIGKGPVLVGAENA